MRRICYPSTDELSRPQITHLPRGHSSDPDTAVGPLCACAQTKRLNEKGTKVRRYNWHSAGSRGWPFQMLKY